jgi:hypothetical protein
MTITLELPSETEAHLIAQAAALGMSVESYLMSLIEERVTVEFEETSHTSSKIQNWEDALAKLEQSQSLSKAPFLSDGAISRKSIYHEREDRGTGSVRWGRIKPCCT